MKNICIVAGARPNFIKVAPLLRTFSQRNDASCTLVYAGCKNDPTIEPSLFSDLQIAEPDVYLGVDSVSLNEITSRVMAEFDAYLDRTPTDVVIVVDDLASTMAAAIVTKKRGVQLAHLVAGTRSFDIAMPKEINRLVIDALSDYLFTAGMKSNSVATREQSDKSQTYMVGNILMDSLRFNQSRLRKPNLDIREGEYIVLTLNRKALLADKEALRKVISTIAKEAQQMNATVIAPLRNMAAETVAEIKKEIGKETGESIDNVIRTTQSLNYLEFGWLTAHARCVITDSGNVAEEATFNGVPCITLNDYTEHQETVSVGTNVLVGTDTAKLSETLQTLARGEWKKSALPDRWDGRTAERIAQVIIG